MRATVDSWRPGFVVLSLLLAVACSAPPPSTAAGDDAARPAEDVAADVGDDDQPPAEPATLEVAVEPAGVAAGGSARVTVRLTPKDGIKINKYPKLKLDVPGRDGLWAGGHAEVGNDAPPPPEKSESNYFKSVDPLAVELPIDGDAGAGRYEVEGSLTYFYCVTASGFCAPARVPVSFELEIL